MLSFSFCEVCIVLKFTSGQMDYFPIFAKILLMRRTKLILSVLTCLLLFFSPLQKQFHIIHFRSLKGVEEEKPMPELTLATYRDGSFQSGTEQHLKQQFGGREPLIRLYNQYLWDCFGKTNATQWQIAMGKDGWFYEPWFVEDYYHGGTYSQSCDSAQLVKQFEEEAFRIYQLQHVLESYGTHLFVCLLPGKDLVYPEYLPENKKCTKKKIISSRDFYGPKFKELGINHVDVEQWFLQMKDTASFSLFPKTGTHWSNIASLYVADSVIRYMEELGGMNISNLKIGASYIDKTREPDDDLESLMNLIRPLDQNYNRYADVVADGDSTAVKPKIIVIGDSFFWNISQQLPMSEIFAAAPYWYYNSTVYYDDVHNSTKDIDVLKELLSADFVILSYCSLQLYDMSNDFSKNALVNICFDSIDHVQRRIGLENYIRSDEDWFAQEVDKANKRGCSVDEILTSDAAYLIENNLRKHYPEMFDSVPQRRSASFRKLLEPENIIEAYMERIGRTDLVWKKSWRRWTARLNKGEISVDSMLKLDLRRVVDRQIESEGWEKITKLAYR